MPRAISVNFLKELKRSPILILVREDNTLDMELRGAFVTVYYRGCAIISIAENMKMYECDNEYFSKTGVIKRSLTDYSLADYIERSKSAINKFIFHFKENSETETQQLIVRENNYSAISNTTDYFIVDIEYKDKRGKEFDLIALRWQKQHRSNPKNSNLQLTVFELKYGVNAVGNSKAESKKASLSAHMEDFNNFMTKTSEVALFREDMCNVFKQKCELGLIRFGETKQDYRNGFIGNKWAISIKSFSEKIEFGYIFANYNKKSTLIKKELGKFSDDFVFTTAAFMGYGLYFDEIKHRSDLCKI